ncbi:hypothetical protein [Beduini massiliensis]|uniref:hypothetical protein n=1 Tax=Beduini massiliensis TaxID=1585974 RepID=UPI00059AB450|nr:hypothetical protein [Beduini massiliensis]
MLKLLKYELIGSYRQYLLTFVIYLLLCCATPFLPAVINQFLSGLLMVALFGIVISIFVNIVQHFSRSMFSRPGYLTLTLPVSSKELVFSKMIGALIWTFAAFFILGLGLMILMMLIADFSFGDIFTAINQFCYYISLYPGAVVRSLIAALTSTLAMIASFYFTITFVHTKYVTKNRVLIGVGGYILGLLALGFIMDSSLFYGLINSLNGTSLYIFNIFINAVFLVVFFVGTTYLIDNKLQIE